MPEEYQRRVCAVCGRVLDRKDDRWFHGLATADDPDVKDHPAIAVLDSDVPLAHIRAKCDFCFADDPEYILPARTFEVPGGFGGSDGDWAPCGACADLIDRNDWNGLLRRAVAGYEVRNHVVLGETETRALASLYRRLRKNITGSIRPVNPAGVTRDC
jgi:hypothetical protein